VEALPMNLSITLAGTNPAGEGDLDSLHQWLVVEPLNFASVRLVHRPGQPDTAPVAQELIAPLAELDPPGLQALPQAVALWVEQQRSDLEVGYRCPDGTEMVVKLTPARNPEQVLRQVIEAATAAR
jgi:hypothetical protein